MLGWLRRALGQSTPELDDLARELLRRELPQLEGRSAEELQGIARLTARFLAERDITGVQGLELDRRQRLLLAAQASLPLLHLPFEWLGHWHQVLVYPGQFRVRRHDRDADTEVVTEWDDDLAGESWSHGPIVLSWADVEQDLAAPWDGFNVVIHEIAHKLDLSDGESDGVPPMHDLAQRRRWKEVLARHYELHAQAVEHGEDTALDPYAAEAPDEFFAVASEYYFSAPDVLAEHYPEVFEGLRAFYGPVPRPPG